MHDELEARLEVLAAAVQAIAAALPPEQAAKAAQGLRERVEALDVAADADEAVSVDLARLLQALRI